MQMSHAKSYPIFTCPKCYLNMLKSVRIAWLQVGDEKHRDGQRVYAHEHASKGMGAEHAHARHLYGRGSILHMSAFAHTDATQSVGII